METLTVCKMEERSQSQEEMKLRQNSSWLTRTPSNKGTLTGQIPKNKLGPVIITIILETHTSFLGEQRKQILERSPAVISVHLKFPAGQMWGLDFLYLPCTICQPFTVVRMVTVCRRGKGSISSCGRSVPAYSLASPCTSMVPWPLWSWYHSNVHSLGFLK